MRASKLRFPDRTLAAIRSLAVTVSSNSRSSGPELPMQVVQPKPTTLKPSRSRNGCRPVFMRYSLTTREPGASDVFTHGLVRRPSSIAFRASRPAASITAGFDVLVHDVMAAITTSPWANSTVDDADAGASIVASRFGVGRLFIISASVNVLVLCDRPSGRVSPDWSPPPGRGALPLARRTVARRPASGLL